MLGSDLVKACQAGFDTAVFDLPEFDITDYRHLNEVVKGASAVINCAAYTNVDKAESEQDLAYEVNAEAAGRLGESAAKAGVWVLHFSTDFVFDGKLDRPYIETDAPNPINTYGKTKLAGERLLLESSCRCCIIRVEWTYGLHGINFVTKLLQLARTQHRLKVVDDQIGSPTATTQVAEMVVKLLTERPEGIFHFASDGYVSRYAMARFIFEKMAADVEVHPCKTSEFIRPAERPLNSRFDCSKIKALIQQPIEPWQVALERFLRRL